MMIIIEMSRENDDINVFSSYNKIQLSHICKKLGQTIKLV